MSRAFEQLSWDETPMGVLGLRRRLESVTNTDVYEVKLGDEYLMSSAFTVAEIELARLGLSAHDGDELDVVVGGLGLGYTADAACDDPRVRSVVVVEALPEVIAWHEQRLLPEVERLADDERVRLVQGDFFARCADEDGFDPAVPGRTFDVVLLDIDHTPRHVLADSHATFYTPAGLAGLRRHLAEGGVFALWSDDPPDEPFLELLRESFAEARAEVVTFPNPLTGGESSNTIYLAS